MAPNWDDTQMPSQRGRIALVTGAAQGLGLECARQLVRHGARVIIADVNETQAQLAVHELRALALTVESSAEIEFLWMDAGSMDSVKSLAAAVRAKVEHLDILINNAGVWKMKGLCTDGFGLQFGVNHLGHFYLTTLLFDLLKKSDAARVVNVSSLAHRQDFSLLACNPRALDFTKIAYGEGDTAWMGYEKSKLCNLLFTYELDRRLRAAGITNVKSVVAHPGVTQTNIWEGLGFFLAPMLQTVEMGSLPILYAATAPEAESGAYYGPNRCFNYFGYPTRNESTPQSHSQSHARELWQLSESLTKVPFTVAPRAG